MRTPHVWLAVLLCAATPRDGYASTPDVGAVTAEALRHARLDGRLDRWSARARLRHLMPKITATVGRWEDDFYGTGFTEYLTRGPSGDLLFDTARTQIDDDQRHRLYYSVRATLDLGGLIFDPVEIAASREARGLAAERRALLADVQASYFEWRALDASPNAENSARREALAAHLDALTGGWFNRQIGSEGGPR